MSIDTAEIERFNRLSAFWWDSGGPMRPLHRINALRLDYVCCLVAARFGSSPADLSGVRIVDVGCGAGLMSEPLAQRGARVTGIDASSKNIAAARIHAADGRLAIDYREGDPSSVLGDGECFDVILLLEVVEHVPDPAAFLAAASRYLTPGGLLVVSTINRTAKSYLFAIIGAEHLFRLLPKGTHTWARFVRPAEMRQAAAAAGLELLDLRGMRYVPVIHRASWTKNASVNYIAVFERRNEPGPAKIV